MPVELAKQLDLQPGTRFQWEAGAAPGTILVRVQPSISQRLTRAQQIGKKHKTRDFVAELIAERELDR